MTSDEKGNAHAPPDLMKSRRRERGANETEDRVDCESKRGPPSFAVLEKRVAAACWRNHKLREDHPVTALFGGQTRRELCCDTDPRERSVGFDAFTELVLPLNDLTGGVDKVEMLNVRCRVRFARQRLWPLDVVARVPHDATVADVLEAVAKLRLASARAHSAQDTHDRIEDSAVVVFFGVI